MFSMLLNTLLNFGEKMMPFCYEVVNMSITASYIFIAIFLCRLFLKRAPKVYSYALWLVLLFRLLCPISLPSPVSVLNVLQWNDRQNTIHMEYISPEIEVAQEPAVDLGIPSLTQQVNQILPAPTPGGSANPMQIQAFVYTNIWLLGVCGMVVYALLSMRRIRKMTALAIRIQPGIYEGEEISSPFAKGLLVKGLFGTRFLQSTIYLPAHLSEIEKQVILAHERMHLHRLDPLVKGLYFIALTLHWFNPFVWVAFYLMNRDMEMSCDEAVLQSMDVSTVDKSTVDKKTGEEYAALYSDTLLSIAVKSPVRKRLRVVGPLAFGENSVSARIKNALKFHPASFRRKMVLAVVCGAMVLACSCNPSMDGTSSFPRLNYYMDRLTAFWTGDSGSISMADQLWEHRTPYIGDNSAVGNLLGALEVPDELQIVSEGMELETSRHPYRLIIRYHAENPEGQVILSEDSVWIYRNMALLFPLIENVDIIETQISYGEDTTYYCMMTRFEAGHAMDGNLTDIVISTKEDWNVAFRWIRDIDFRTKGVITIGYEEAYADRHYMVVTFESFDKANERMLVSGSWQGQNGQSTPFYMEMDGLVYDEYSDFMLIEELQPGDRLLVGYVAAEDGVPLSEVVYKQKVPDWFATE